MGHLSIAIIRRSFSTLEKVDSNPILGTEDTCKYEYLVIKTKKDKYKFFDSQPINSIGDGFDYSGFKNKVLKFLHLESSDIQKFKHQPSLFKTSGSKHDATACLYELTDIQREKMIIDGFESEWISADTLNGLKNKWIKEQDFIFKSEKPFSEVVFSNEFHTDIRNIVKAKQNNKLVIFAGAGVSMDSGLPNWNTLVEAFQSEIDEKEGDPLKAAQLHFNHRRKKENLDRLKEILKYKQTKFNLIHEQIVLLSPYHIITTNFDDHFEQIINKEHLKYSIVKKDADLPDCKTNSFLVKMHGDIAEKNVVLKKDDYDHYQDNFPLIKGFVEGIFATNLVLFVGFSFDDPNLIEILDRVNKILDGNNQPPYLLYIPSKDKEHEYEDSKIEELSSKGVKVVKYNDSSITKYYDQIKKSAKEVARKGELKEIGQKVYKFLKVIDGYDYFQDEALSQKDIVDQLIGSLDRFNGLRALPATTLTSITPFKVIINTQYDKNQNADYTPFTLAILNENLLEYLNPENKKKIELNIENSHDSSTDKYWSQLFNSGVRYIKRKNDLNSPEIELIHLKNDVSCECLQCLLTDFKYGKVLSLLESETSFATNDESDNIYQAYAYMKTGQFVKAYSLFENIKSQASAVQSYIVFFISCYNQRLIRNYIHFWNEQNGSEDYFDEIKQSIDSVNIDKIILEMPIHDDVKKTLIYIKENSILIDTRKQIKEDIIRVKEIYNNYKQEGFSSSGPCYWFKIESQFYLVWNFYYKNFLFNDETIEFSDLSHDYIETMIASNMVSLKYEQRLKFYSPFFNLVFCTYGIPDKLKKILQEYSVEKFDFEESEKVLKDLEESFQNLCRSGYDKTDFLGESINENMLFEFRTTNLSFFANKIQRQFGNFMLLFPKLDLGETAVNNVLVETLNFLEVSTLFNFHDSHKYFLEFVSKYIFLFSEQNITRLINYSISDNIWSAPVISSICDSIINKISQPAIIDEDLYMRILNRTNERRKRSTYIADVTPFYQLLVPELRSDFYQKIQVEYSTDCIRNCGVNPYSSLYKWGVWNPIDNNDMFDMFLTSLFEKTKGYPDIEINDNLESVNINSYAGLNELYFFVALTYKCKLFDHESVSKVYEHINSLMFKWALKPNDFDYSLFDYKWIAYLKISEMYPILREIPPLIEAVKIQLSKKFISEIAEVYCLRLL
jgi:hypothetical protein